MDSNGACGQPNGFSPNGLLPTATASSTRVLDPQIWSIAEERTAELIDLIQPNKPSEERRNAIANYVQRLISKCFSCEVFTFGSVPLKTYLPDGDIDVTAFSKNQNLKETWADEVRDMLESEEKSAAAEFRVKEVQYIQAEVRIIKCLVENIVVDISFNQLGGLCTLCFLEEVDSMIKQNHLLKRSIILIKAWCYYESRILGAHHGLISTYALEILVLYIFHVFDNSFAGPLEVLYRFMEFFSKFDWENFCVSLWGPVPMSSLPQMLAVPPRRDQEQLLPSQMFLRACNSVFTVLPGGLENNDLPFTSKFLNVIDPLRTNNNLGRSVTKGNFYRIRSAFAFGAQRLARLLDCPKENIVAEVNQFFFNTLDRHGKGERPDAPTVPDTFCPQPVNPNHSIGSNSQRSSNETSNGHEPDQIRSSPLIPYGNINADRDKSNRSNFLRNEPSARFHLARTNSSPELTDMNEISSLSKGRTRRAPEQIKQNNVIDTNVESKLSNGIDDRASLETIQMHQEEQDRVNMMASAGVPHFNESSLHIPMNLMSLGYGQRNDMLPTNISSFGPHWGPNMQYSHNIPVSQYVPSFGPSSNHREEIVEHFENSKRMYHEDDADNALGSEQDESYIARAHFSRRENTRTWRESNGVNSHHSNRTQNSFYSANQRFVTAPHVTYSRPRLPLGIPSDGTYSKKSTRERRGKKSIPSMDRSISDKYDPRYECDSTDYCSPRADDDNGDWIPLSTAESETAESVVSTAESIVPSSIAQAHQMHNYEQLQMNNGSMPPPSMLPNGSIPLGSRPVDNNGVLPFAVYQMAPPFFLTMLPFYNFANDVANSDASTSQSDKDNQYDHQRLSLTENVDIPESSRECKSDILLGDYRSHFQNLLYGWECQYPVAEGARVYHQPGVGAAPYNFPRDGPTRPLSTNANLFNQLMGYGGGAPLLPLQQHGLGRPAATQHQQYGDEMPRNRTGTGTYLPNPQRISRDRQSSNSRNGRGSYGHDRKEYNADRDSNWNITKQRYAARNQDRNQQLERLNPRLDRTAPNSRRSDRQWEPDTSSHPNHGGQNGHFTPSNMVHNGSNNIPYGMYPVQMMNPNGGGPFVMLYPYEQQNTGFNSNGDHPVEFGSMQYGESSSSRVSADQQNVMLNSTRSSPEPPASPVHPRGV
jgi:hypothetical protein